jgi:hypothetical protein
MGCWGSSGGKLRRLLLHQAPRVALPRPACIKIQDTPGLWRNRVKAKARRSLRRTHALRASAGTGEPQDTSIAASSYKTLLCELMPVDKARGDRNTYSKVTYTLEGEFVRIEASRFSGLKQRTSPMRLLIGRSSSGRWLVYEELSESQQ